MFVLGGDRGRERLRLVEYPGAIREHSASTKRDGYSANNSSARNWRRLQLRGGDARMGSDGGADRDNEKKDERIRSIQFRHWRVE